MLLNTLLGHKTTQRPFTSRLLTSPALGHDVTHEASLLGLANSIFVDDEVWTDAIDWSPRDSAKQGVELDALSRLQSLLVQFRTAARGAGTTTIYFSHMRVPRDGFSSEEQRIRLVGDYVHAEHGTMLHIHFLSE